MTLRTFPKMEQRSAKWYEARCGMVTASVMSTLITSVQPAANIVPCPTCKAEVGKACISAARKTPTEIKTFHEERVAQTAGFAPIYGPADNDTSKALILALAAERVTDFVEDTFETYDMRRGIDSEPYARALYAEHCADRPVEEIGFMVREFDGFKIGYSPDGLVGDDGLIEIKAPRQRGHLSTIVGGKVPVQHMAQLQTALLVSGREWIDFVSYSGGMHLWPKRVTPDPAWQAGILAAAEKAENDIEAHVATYQRATEGLPLAERIDFNRVELKLA